MKTQSILKTALITAGFSAFTLIGSAQAQVINVAVTYNNNPVLYSGQGAYSDPGNNLWNDLNVANQATGLPTPNYTLSNLSTSTGATSGVTLTYNNPDTIIVGDYNFIPAAATLLNTFVQNNDEPGTITLSGLNATNTYDLFIYSQAGAINYAGGGSFTIGSTTLESANTSALASTTFIKGQNYVEFTGLTGSAALTITQNFGDSGSNNSDLFNGLQLVDTTAPAEVPEPSTYALMGLGALALLVISRRRRTV